MTVVPFLRPPIAQLTALLMLGALLPACTTTTIEPELVQTPGQTYETIVVGEIAVEQDIWQGRLPYLREGLIGKLKESGAFSQVLETVPEQVGSSAIILTGTVTEVEKGNKALRFLIGFGAGRARAEGVFEIQDSQRAVLARFTSAKAYSGGAGIGGFDMIDMDELMGELGTATAESVIRWSNGESLEPPRKNE